MLETLKDFFRAWRRALKAASPYVRRREYLVVQHNHAELIEALDGRATAASDAKIHVVKSIKSGLGGEVCLFVSFVEKDSLKAHVVGHITHLIAAGVKVVLVLNTDTPASRIKIPDSMQERLSGLLVRENIGFDFGAWAHALMLCANRSLWERLYLVNDSIFGPLSGTDFDRMMVRVRGCSADVVGLTESLMPRRHLQSYFLVFNNAAMNSAVVNAFFRRVRNWPAKSQVIEIYEVRLTAILEAQGLCCEALFPSLSRDVLSSDDTSIRWAKLVVGGFPYIKMRVIDKYPRDERIKAWLAHQAKQTVTDVS